VDLKVVNSDVRLALSSLEETYLFTKALEFCSENSAKLRLGSLEAVANNCVSPLVNILKEQLQSGKVRRLQEVLSQKAPAAEPSKDDTVVSSILISYG
jgi:hypothetical protein